jgi:hypothetical protein
VESGGRYTERTNDLTLGYARAQRDLACVYSLGIYVDPKEDSPRRVRIDMQPAGLRAVHPSRFVFRSDEKQRESLLRAAWVSPQSFQTGLVRAHLFPLRPTSTDSWDGMLAITFPVPLDARGGDAVRRDFGAVLTRALGLGGEKVIHRFHRRVTLQPLRPGVTSEPSVTFLQRVDLEPGIYEVTAVLHDPDGLEPHAARAEIEVPAIPRRDHRAYAFAAWGRGDRQARDRGAVAGRRQETAVPAAVGRAAGLRDPGWRIRLHRGAARRPGRGGAALGPVPRRRMNHQSA